MAADQPIAVSGAEGISVVIPFYNEEPNIEPLCERLIPVLERIARPFEIVLVDDGSTDRGGALALRQAEADHRIRVIALEARSGQSAALDAGFRAARQPIVVTMDADLQNDPEDIPGLIDKLGGADVVCGIRQRRHDTWVRRASSVIANRVRDRITGDHVTDTGCSLKAYRIEMLRRLKLYNGMHRFLPTLLRFEGARVVEVPVRHHPRSAGRSKYGISNRALVGLRDCFAVRWMRDRHLRYRVKEM
jgi:dolichol-phosphate mannosyltransferase